MTHYLHVITGSCPQTEAEARIEMAETAEAEGRPMEALQWRGVLARWRRDWRARGPAALGGDPDRMVEPIDLMFWHDPREHGVVCSCGHFSTLLCDEPVGRGLTCDIALCKCCRTAIGDDLDLCPLHAARQRQRERTR